MSLYNEPADARTPVEVWENILQHALDADSFYMDVDPVKPNTNMPVLLGQWHSPSVTNEILEIRTKLLLVCKSWNYLVKQMPLSFLRLQHLLQLRWPESYLCKAKRIQVELYGPRCRCLNGLCTCGRRKLGVSDVMSAWEAALNAKDSFQAEILILITAATESRDLLVFRDKFPNLKALSLYTDLPLNCVDKYVNLVYLQINTSSRVRLIDSSHPVIFPNLTTLRLDFLSRSYQMIQSFIGPLCSMPVLRHLYIDCHSHVVYHTLCDCLELVGRNLISLAISFQFHSPTTLDEGFWRLVPRLQSLVLELSEWSNLIFCSPPTTVPLQVLVASKNVSEHTLKLIEHHVVDCSTIRRVGCNHNWSFVHSNRTSKVPRMAQSFQIRLLGLASMLKEKGIRFEDCHGKTYEENEEARENGK